jgi:DNA repair protein RecO (recombination protein O)
MKQIITKGIILSRTDFGEADRILTLLTPDQGKLRLIAKGVRRVKSKLAGGIELFSVSDITFIRGRSDIGTLVSTRLVKHYATIVKDVGRTMAGYDIIKRLNKATEDEPEEEYFELMKQAFEVLDVPSIPLELINIWFQAQLLRLSGHTPNLSTSADGGKLSAEARYDFSFDDVSFAHRPDGSFGADDIKFLRILFSGTPPEVIAKVQGAPALAEHSRQLVQMMSQQYILRQ